MRLAAYLAIMAAWGVLALLALALFALGRALWRMAKG